MASEVDTAGGKADPRSVLAKNDSETFAVTVKSEGGSSKGGRGDGGWGGGERGNNKRNRKAAELMDAGAQPQQSGNIWAHWGVKGGRGNYKNQRY